MKEFLFGLTDQKLVSKFVPEQWRYISASKFFVLFWFVLVPCLTLLTFAFLSIITASSMWVVNTLFESELTLNWLMIIGFMGLSLYINLPNNMKARLVYPTST